MNDTSKSASGVIVIKTQHIVFCFLAALAIYVVGCASLKNTAGKVLYSKKTEQVAPAVTNQVVVAEENLAAIAEEAALAGRVVTGTNFITQTNFVEISVTNDVTGEVEKLLQEVRETQAALTIVKPAEVQETFTPSKTAEKGVRMLFGFLPIPGGTWAAEAVLALMAAGGAAYGHRRGKRSGGAEQEARWKQVLGKTVKGFDVFRQEMKRRLRPIDGVDQNDVDRKALKMMKKAHQGAGVIAEVGEAVLNFTDENTFTDSDDD